MRETFMVCDGCGARESEQVTLPDDVADLGQRATCDPSLRSEFDAAVANVMELRARWIRVSRRSDMALSPDLDFCSPACVAKNVERCMTDRQLRQPIASALYAPCYGCMGTPVPETLPTGGKP